MTAPADVLRFGSLFAGIGGLDLGLERAGMSCAWQVEIDDYAQKVLAKHWPDVPRFRDVREVGAHNLAPVDVICGGFPCQDISNAGKRAGIDGERSGLWAEYARIIREVRPRYVLVENVAALLARGLGRVLGDLAESGFDAEWDCIPAAAVGAPHRRDRLFLVAYARRAGRGAEDGRRDSSQQGAGSGRQETTGGAGECGALLAAAAGKGLEGVPRGGIQRRLFAAGGLRQFDQWATEPDVGRVAHGVRSRVDRLRCLGNAVVPQVAEFVGRRILAHARGE
jgi:DNA (cytosine-5)-methyltransferase 1